MDIRRLQTTGGSSLTVTLPKEWTTAMKLDRNDAVRVAPQPDGTLMITADLTEDSVRRAREFDVSSCTNPTFLFRSLIGAYIAGYTEIVVSSKTRLAPFVRTTVRHFTQMTIGQEVMEETDRMIRVRDLLNPNELPFDNTIKRMYVITRSMHEDAITAVLSRDQTLASDVVAEDRDVDRLQWLVARQSNMLMRNANLVLRSGLSPSSIASHAVISRIIERIADHAVRIATNAIALSDHSLEPELTDRLREASAFSLGVLDRAIKAFFSRDMALANRAIEEVQKADALAEAVHTLALSQPAGPAVALGYIAESVRRLGEYAGDIAEAVINDVVEQQR